MAQERIEVGVVVSRLRLKGPWASHAWLPRAVLPAASIAAPWTRLGADGDEESFYAGGAALLLHSGETSHYRDNLTSKRPSLWIALRPVGVEAYEVALVTADPYEGEALATGLEDIVEAVAMPKEIEQKLAAFVEKFHVEHQFLKRQRDDAHEEALARRDQEGPDK